jgi:hypothetical protein
MKISNIIATFIVSLVTFNQAPALSQIIIGSVNVYSAEGIKQARFAELSGIIARMPPNLPKLSGIEKRDISILFVSPDTETIRREFFFKRVFKPPINNQELIAIDAKIVQQFIWLSLEITGFVSKIDAVETEFFNKSIEKNYDYIVNVSTNFNDKKGLKSGQELVYTYTLKSTINNKTAIISKITKSYTRPSDIAAVLFKAADGLEK